MRACVCVFFLSFRYAERTFSALHHIFRCGLSGWTNNVCFDLLYNSVSNISHSKKYSARYYHVVQTQFLRNSQVLHIFMRRTRQIYILPHPLPSVSVTLYLLYVPITTSCLHSAGTRDALHRNLKCRKMTQIITTLNWPNILRTAGSFGGVYPKFQTIRTGDS
jgi:hypothetical protein